MCRVHKGGGPSSRRQGLGQSLVTLLPQDCAQTVDVGTLPPPPGASPSSSRGPSEGPSLSGAPEGRRGGLRGGASYLLASEITLLVASASCWHLIFSAVAFSKAEVRLLRLALSSWKNEMGVLTWTEQQPP